jgi:hypothetical protein
MLSQSLVMSRLQGAVIITAMPQLASFHTGLAALLGFVGPAGIIFLALKV